MSEHIIKVHDNGITQVDDKLVVEASCLGLKPGQWPEQISLRGRIWQKDEVVFHRDQYGYDDKSNVANVIYRPANETLVIIND